MISLKTLVLEGRYDYLVTQLSNRLLRVVKDSYEATKTDSGEFAGKKIYFKQGESVPEIHGDNYYDVYFEEVENETIPLDFYLALRIQWVDSLNDYRRGGDAYNDQKQNSSESEVPYIEIRFELDPTDFPKILSSVAMDVRDTLRHEIEHLTQAGWNVKSSKYIPSDQALRRKIESGKLPPARYFTLPQEIPAMIQGMYFKAKKSKKPFAQVVDEYLQLWVDNAAMTSQEKQSIIDTWKTYLPKLGIKATL
mgnify:FL=1|jgi:hypothetical protein